MISLIIGSLSISIFIIALTWLFARSFFFQVFNNVLSMFSEYSTQLQSANTGAKLLHVFSINVSYLFPVKVKIVIWFAFNKKSQPLLCYNIDQSTINYAAIRGEFAKISNTMLIDLEQNVSEKLMPHIVPKFKKMTRVFSFPFVNKGILFGVVHVFVPKCHIGVRRRSLIKLYSQTAKARFLQLASERATLRIASDIGAIEKSFEALIDAAPVGMIICETDLSVRYMNQTAGTLLETTAILQTGSLFLNFFTDASQRHRIERMASNILQKKSTRQFESKFKFISPNNTQMYFDIHSYPIKSSTGKIVEIVFVIHDGTKRYHLEEELNATQKDYQSELETKVNNATQDLVAANLELQRLNTLKSEFVSTISHELRTPLTSIIGYLSLLKTKRLGILNDKQINSINILSEEADRLASLINDILDMSRLESGKSSLRFKEVLVSDVIHKEITLLQPLFEKRKLTLSFENSIPVVAIIDKEKLQQILTNLLSNAIKFSDFKKHVTITLTKDAKYCIISIQDQGYGISKLDLPHIFESFYRSEIAKTHAIKGTGLGLPIVKHLVDMHNGKIEVHSQLGKGTTFTIMLPLKQKISKNL